MKILIVLSLVLFSTCASAQCLVDVDGVLTLTSATIDTCQGFWISSASDVRNYQTVEVTPENFAKAFGFGVSCVLTFWFIPYVGSVVGNVIRKM